jgi:two-component system sensor histidine kinase TctE
MSSIRIRLLKWLVGPVILINLAGAGLTYLLAWTPAQVAFDQGLLDAAGALAARLRVGAAAVPRADGLDPTWFSVRGADGRLLAGDPDFAPAGAAGTAQPYDATLRGEPVRAVVVVTQAGGEQLQVGAARAVRRLRQVRSATLRSLALIEVALTFALVGVVWLSVSNGLAPLARMRANLAARDGDDLTPVGLADMPYELAPMVGAFNDLLAKAQSGADARHDFLADMAHQLRTPLAGLKLQLEWLGARHGADPETGHSIGLMRLATERMIRQTNQLLALARATAAATGKARMQRLDLARLVQESVQYFVDEADRKGVDIGFDLAPAPVEGDPFQLRDLIDNLVDNAVRYTPGGGAVTVRCGRDEHGSVLVVEDSGPGIAPAKRAVVFARFVRLGDTTPGSGLGLAVVRDIARVHRARVTLDSRAGGSGAVFMVRFPADLTGSSRS